MLTLASAATPAADTIEDHLGRKRANVADKGRQIAEAEAEYAQLATKDAQLCNAISENRSKASEPEPQAVDFDKLDDWHAAARDWRGQKEDLDRALLPIERERDRIATNDLPAAKSRIDALRRELAWLELDLAKDEHIVAQGHADEALSRVRRLQGALAAIS